MPAVKTRTDIWRIALTTWIVIALTYVFLIPVGNNLLLYPLLLSFALIAGVNFLKRRIMPDKSFIWPAAFWVAFLVVGIVSGIAQDAESWARTLVFFLVWPAVYAVIIAGFDRRVVKLIFWVGAVVSIVIGLLFYWEGLVASGHLSVEVPSPLAKLINLRHVTDETGMVAMTSTILPPLIWFGGMWVASLFVDARDKYLPPTWLRFIAATLIIAGALIAWRRAVVVVIILVPIVALVGILVLKLRNANTDSPRISWRGIISTAVAFVLAFGLTLTVQPSLGQMFAHLAGSSVSAVAPAPVKSAAPLTQEEVAPEAKPTKVADDDELDDRIRQNESKSLLKAETPVQVLVGHGFGATFDRGGIDRPIRPWQTELQYHALFYWTGIIGILLLVATVISGLGVLRKAFRLEDDLRGVLFVAAVGSVAVILANGTNPYLQAPGHMWPLFFPLMVASAIFAARKTTAAGLESEPQRAGAALN